MVKNRKVILFALTAVVVLTAVVLVSTKSGRDAQALFLQKYGLENLEIKDIVKRLDSRIDEPSNLFSSITSEQLILKDESQEVRLNLPKEEFYLSFAPYFNTTHPCATHSPSSCRGELVGEKMHVTIKALSGEVLVEDDMTTMDNGFIGVWLPRDIKATVNVDYLGKTASAPIETSTGSDTCLTTPLKFN